MPAPDDEVLFPHLRLVDPYGETYFNQVQMAAVIPELFRLRQTASDPFRIEALDAIIALAERCSATIGAYLVFRGD